MGGTPEDKKMDYFQNSSTESLILSRGKNVTINDPKEVRFIKPNKNNNNYQIKDDRILIVSRKSPFFLFSALPYYKGRNGRYELRKEGQRRRNISGNRPLSSINDQPFDAFNMLGIERPLDYGMEVSYGHLLIPSRPNQKEKRHQNIEANIDVIGTPALKNHTNARYLALEAHRYLTASPCPNVQGIYDLKQLDLEDNSIIAAQIGSVSLFFFVIFF